MNKIRIQGTYELEFRKSVTHLCKQLNLSLESKELLKSHRLCTTFKDIMLKVFLKHHTSNKVISSREDIKKLLTDAIWAEFIDICSISNIEIAITIIFKRYEK